MLIVKATTPRPLNLPLHLIRLLAQPWLSLLQPEPALHVQFRRSSVVGVSKTKIQIACPTRLSVPAGLAGTGPISPKCPVKVLECNTS